MEKIVDFITDNFTMSVLVLLGIVSPGILTILLYGFSIFDRWDILKIFTLSSAIAMPTASAIYISVRAFWLTSKDEIKNALVFSLAFNEVLFILALIICYFLNLDIKQFIISLIVEVIVVAVKLFSDAQKDKDNKKSSLDEVKEEQY